MSDNNTSAIKIAVLEQKSDMQSRAIDRIDSAIEKIAETNQHILKMLALHDEKISNGEKSGLYFSKELDEVRNQSHLYYEELKKKLDGMDEKVSELMKLKWMTIGMTTLLMILIGAMTQLAGGIIKKEDLSIRQSQTHMETSNQQR